MDADVLQRDGRVDGGRPGAVIEVHAELEFAPEEVGAGAVGLVDAEDVRNFEEAGLHGLDGVPALGGEHHEHGVGDLQHRELTLPHADRLHEDAVVAAGVEEVDDVARRAGEPPEVPAGREGAQVDAGVLRVAVHAHAVAEDGPARPGRRRVDGHHRDPLPARAGGRDEAIGEGALPGARRPGDADDVGGAATRGGRLRGCGHASRPDLRPRGERGPVTTTGGERAGLRGRSPRLQDGDGAGEGAAVAGESTLEQGSVVGHVPGLLTRRLPAQTRARTPRWRRGRTGRPRRTRPRPRCPRPYRARRRTPRGRSPAACGRPPHPPANPSASATASVGTNHAGRGRPAVTSTWVTARRASRGIPSSP